MSIADDIVTVLEADNGVGGVATLLVGGIYTWGETKALGLSADNTPNAFTSAGLVRPSMVVKERAEVPDNGVVDDGAQNVSYRQVVELWLYDDGDTGYGTLKAAKTQAFTLLHGKAIGTSKLIPRWAGNPIRDGRDPALNHACIMRDDYEVRGMM